MVIAGVTVAAANYAKSYMDAKDLFEVEHNVRVASEMIFRDLRTAGYGVHETAHALDAWVDWIPGVTSSVVVVQGASMSDPDQLVTVGSRVVPGGELQIDATAGSTVLTLKSGGVLNFNTTTDKLLVLDRLETARVVNITGNDLIISTDPSVNNVGLAFDHPANSPVELVTIVTYQCVSTNLTATGGQPYLARFQNTTAATSSTLLSIAAMGIEELQLTADTNDTYRVVLTGRCTRNDPDYVHPAKGDHYRRYELDMTMQSWN